MNSIPFFSGVLTISGKQAKQLLQGQLTCHMEDITEKYTLGAHCNSKGKVINFFQIYRADEQYHLNMPLEMLAIAQQALQKYAIFYSDIVFQTSILDAYVNDLDRIRAK